MSAPPVWPDRFSRNRISLAQLTLDPVSSAGFIDAAAVAGFRSIGMRLVAPPGADVTALSFTAQDVARLRQRMHDAAIVPHLATGLWVRSDTDPHDYASALDLASSLGVETMLVVVNDKDTKRALDRFVILSELAAARDLRLALEFMAYTGLTTLAAAAHFLECAAVPNAGLIIDALHLARSGGTPADVARLNPSTVALVQLCDAPAVAPGFEALRDEARNRRELPGEGELPLDALLDALPAGVWLDIEAPTAARGSAEEKARRAALATARLLDLHMRRVVSP
jgi:sugar phosphate isomerase/epimerase